MGSADVEGRHKTSRRDLSRNGSKQYCTRTCAHRASVAAYRSRNSPR
ncbi:CGNR zinc finger domain-containing protein [Nocardia sp. Root136]|nr:CGNR zinc finger domain-containing protein [Nocardia sp. Root136]